MQNTLEIQNFLIFKQATIAVRKFTVFIGPQASGKSIAAKLLYLFYHLPEEVFDVVREGGDVESVKKRMCEKFLKVFPQETWNRNSFRVNLLTGKGEVAFSGSEGGQLTFVMSQYYVDLINLSIEEIESSLRRDGLVGEKSEGEDFRTRVQLVRKHFHSVSWGFVNNGGSSFVIPAGRSFFATVEDNIFSFISEDFSLDFFLVEFGVKYAQVKRIHKGEFTRVEEPAFSKLLGGVYARKDGKDFIRTKHGQSVLEVRVSQASSGQQELLPILLILAGYRGSFLVIEEPEAHIYPEAQDEISRLIVSRQKPEDVEKAFLITTHSPYVLNALNNMVYAGILSEKFKGNQKVLEALENIYPDAERILPGQLAAYIFRAGDVRNIIDNETYLINAEELDSISYSTGDKFSELLKLEQEGEFDEVAGKQGA